MKKLNVNIVSNDGSSKFSFLLSEYDRPEDCNPSVNLGIKIQSKNIHYENIGYWFDKEDIKKVFDDILLLEKGYNKEVNINAYSEFESKIVKIDDCGHFKFSIKVEDLTSESVFETILNIDFQEILKFKKFFDEVYQGF